MKRMTQTEIWRRYLEIRSDSAQVSTPDGLLDHSSESYNGIDEWIEKTELSRRRLLSLGAALAVGGLPIVPLSAGELTDRQKRRRQRRQARRRRKRRERPLVPRVNGAINIQPVWIFPSEEEPEEIAIIPEIVDLQMQAIYELGFRAIRLTLSFDTLGLNLLGAIPYVRAARALGIRVLGIIGEFGYGHDLAKALVDPVKMEIVLDGYLALYDQPISPASLEVSQSEPIAFQILNEPTNFLGLAPADYVRTFLAPVYDYFKKQRPDLSIVSAATVGQDRGVLRARQMLEAGLEDHTDIVAFHVYDRDTIPGLSSLTSKPVWITESGVRGPDNHLPWVLDTFAELRSSLPTLEQIYFFQLFDLSPGRHRILDIGAREDGVITSEVESQALYDYWVQQVDTARGGVQTAAYRDLVPSIEPYLPTDADVELAASLIQLK